MRGRHWTPEDDERLVELHGNDGASLRSVAAEMGRPQSTVSEKAKALGLSWDRGAMKQAIEAGVVDAKARRTKAALAELELLELTQKRLRESLRGRAKWRAVLKGEFGAERLAEVDAVPSRDLRDESQARASMSQVIDRLDDKSATPELDAAASMLGRLHEALVAERHDEKHDEPEGQ